MSPSASVAFSFSALEKSDVDPSDWVIRSLVQLCGWRNRVAIDRLICPSRSPIKATSYTSMGCTVSLSMVRSGSNY